MFSRNDIDITKDIDRKTFVNAETAENTNTLE